MHKYLTSIGFKDIDYDDLKIIKHDVQAHADLQSLSSLEDSEQIMELRKEYTYHMGIVVKGIEDLDEGFTEEYYFPYFEGDTISTTEDVEIVKNSDRDGYQGIIDDPRLGIDLVFFIIDDSALIHEDYRTHELVNHGNVRLSGLAEKGMVLLPLDETLQPEQDEAQVNLNYELKKSAKEGDQEAIEKLSAEDLNKYYEINDRIDEEDILTIVSTYIMPQGIECDKYTILAEIKKSRKFMNEATRQTLFVLTLESNGILLDTVINSKDIIGDPQPGRRLKADIWLQGMIGQ